MVRVLMNKQEGNIKCLFGLCSGYQSFPRKFKDMIKELNILFGSNIIG